MASREIIYHDQGGEQGLALYIAKQQWGTAEKPTESHKEFFQGFVDCFRDHFDPAFRENNWTNDSGYGRADWFKLNPDSTTNQIIRATFSESHCEVLRNLSELASSYNADIRDDRDITDPLLGRLVVSASERVSLIEPLQGRYRLEGMELKHFLEDD